VAISATARSAAAIVLSLLAGLFAAGCSASPPATAERQCLTDFEPGIDYFPAKASIRHAESFSVSYHNYYKVLTVRSSLTEDDGDKDVMVLLQCGAPPPQLEGPLQGATLIEIPARTIGANEDLSLNRARVLGFAEDVIAMGSEGVYAPELRARWESGAAMTIGESFHGPPDFAKLLARPPDVLFLSTASLGRSGSIVRARELGLAAVPSVSWLERTPLGQAEWLHLVALFLNAEATANEVLAEIESNYVALSQKARESAASPMIVWLDPARQRDQWSVPETSWMAELIEDAGGQTPWARSGGAPTRIVTSEEILALGGAIDAIITASVALAVPGSTGPLERVPAIADGRLFDVHARSRPEHDAYDWYESAVVEVDLVLADFVALLQPDLLPGHEFRHLRRVRQSSEAPPGE